MPSSPFSSPKRPAHHNQTHGATPDGVTDPLVVSAAASKFFSDLCKNCPHTLTDLTVMSIDQLETDSIQEHDQPIHHTHSHPQPHQQAAPTSSKTQPYFELTPPAAAALATSCPSLSSLKLDGVHISSKDAFPPLLLSLPHLTSVVLISDSEKFDIPHVLRSISSQLPTPAPLGLTNLQLILRASKAKTPAPLITTSYIESTEASDREVTLQCSTLETLWIDGCPKTEKVR